jgi:homoserine O-acetyltransferase
MPGRRLPPSRLAVAEGKVHPRSRRRRARIKARLLAINSADDEVNLPMLNTDGPAVASIPGARYVLIPADLTTRGHDTYEQAAKWFARLATLMAE